MSLKNLDRYGWFMLWWTIAIVVDTLEDLPIPPKDRVHMIAKTALDSSYWSPLVIAFSVVIVLYAMLPRSPRPCHGIDDPRGN